MQATTAGDPSGEVRRSRDEVLGLLMLAFAGMELPGPMLERLRSSPAAGITLFRHLNVDTAEQVRALTASIQAAAAAGVSPPDGPLLIAADQEGGQLVALGDAATDFPGSMALGAAGDPELAERVGRATGLELRALGINVAYAPSCDLASNPANTAIGIRSFGSEPAAAGRLAGAFTRGLRSAGVAATAKHFPGLGDADVDSHHGLPVLAHTLERLRAAELVPFSEAIEAGADLVMSAHVGLAAVTGDARLPATLSRAVMHDLLRKDLGFEGLAITDALDMAALQQGPRQIDDVLAALGAGVDLLLCAPDDDARRRIEAGLTDAAARGRLDRASLGRSHARLASLRRWLASHPGPDPGVIGSTAHRELAREVGERSITLVRDEIGLLPLRLSPGARIAAVMPQPADLTPADTSSTVPPGLSAALRREHGPVTELVTSIDPSADEIRAVRAAASDHDVVVVGTIVASLHRGQAELVEALLASGVPTVTVALRTPFDLADYPSAPVHACTYGILPPSLEALAAALFGRIAFKGRLPAPIAGVVAVGHGLAR